MIRFRQSCNAFRSPSFSNVRAASASIVARCPGEASTGAGRCLQAMSKAVACSRSPTSPSPSSGSEIRQNKMKYTRLTSTRNYTILQNCSEVPEQFVFHKTILQQQSGAVRVYSILSMVLEMRIPQLALGYESSPLWVTYLYLFSTFVTFVVYATQVYSRLLYQDSGVCHYIVWFINELNIHKRNWANLIFISSVHL